MMGNTQSKSTNILALEQAIKSDIDKFDFFSLMRYLESDTDLAESSKGQLFQSINPKSELVKITQTPSLSFPKTEIRSVKLDNGKINITINGFGLLSINSPLPIHLLEHIFERQHHHGDTSWVDFINSIQHRLAVLFYQSWASAQSILAIERKSTVRFDDYIESLIGLDMTTSSNSAIDEYSKIFFAGFRFKNRSSHNLAKLLSQYFQTDISIIENIGEWYEVDKSEQTCLGIESGYTLGDGLLLGSRIYDCHTKFRVVVGPLEMDGYQSFFKGEKNYNRLVQWLNDYIGLEHRWEIQLILRHQSAPPLRLNGENRLGLTSWLGQVDRDVDSLIIQ